MRTAIFWLYIALPCALSIGCQVEGDVRLEPAEPAKPAGIVVQNAPPSSAPIEMAIELTPVEVSPTFRDEMRARRDAVPGSVDDGSTILRVQGVLLSSQQSTSHYYFHAEVPSCCYDYHDWFLQYPTGATSYLGRTERFGTQVAFAIPVTAPSGHYKVLVDAYILDIQSQQWIYYDLESAPTTVPILASTPDVGVIPGADGCGSSSEVMFHMDNEDHNQASSVSGWVGKDYVNGAGNTFFHFCRVSGNLFRSLQNASSARTNYAVLQLGAMCPPGSVPFGRYFDNENSNNMNSWVGNISPSTNIGDTWMRFCLFKGDGSTATGLPHLDLEYGVFAETGFGFADTYGTIYTDDEDGGSNGYDADSRWAVAAKKIVGEGRNTTLRTARRATPFCPDGRCNGVETASSCRADCGYCGDGVCFGSETASSCNPDCGYCGDEICGLDEINTCPRDCLSDCFPSLTTGEAQIPEDQFPTCAPSLASPATKQAPTR